MGSVFSAYDYEKKYECIGTHAYKHCSKLMYLILNEKKFGRAVIENYLDENLEEIDLQNENGLTALMLAASNANTYSSIKTVKLLIEAGADINKADVYGKTVLSSAVECVNYTTSEEVIQLLIKSGAKTNVTNLPDSKPLVFTIISNFELNLVKTFVENNNSVNYLIQPKMNNVLMHLLEKSYSSAELPEKMEIIGYLLKNGIDVNQRNNLGETALMIAVNMENNLPIIDLLLKHGADPNIMDNQGNYAPYKYVCKQLSWQLGTEHNDNFIRIFINSVLPKIKNINTIVCNRGETLLSKCLRLSMAPLLVCKLLERPDIDVNTRSLWNETPLITAIKKISGIDLYNIVHLLLNKDANCSIVSIEGLTPLMLILNKDNSDVMYENVFNMIADKSFNLYATNSSGTTALGMVVAKEIILDYVVDKLLERGAHPLLKDKSGMTPLMILIQNDKCQNKLSILDKLIKNIVDKNYGLDSRTPKGLTALMAAVNLNNEDSVHIVKMLLSAGANHNIKNGKGNTALTMAAELACRKRKHKELMMDVIDQLISAGADIKLIRRDTLIKLNLLSINRFLENNESCLIMLEPIGPSGWYYLCPNKSDHVYSATSIANWHGGLNCLLCKIPLDPVIYVNKQE